MERHPRILLRVEFPYCSILAFRYTISSAYTPALCTPRQPSFTPRVWLKSIGHTSSTYNLHQDRG